MNPKILIGLFGPIFLGLIVLFFVVMRKDPPVRVDAPEISTPARVMTVAETTYRPMASGFGSVKPAQIWQVVSEVGGEVIALHPDFEQGGMVAAGAVLLRIDPTEYRLAVDRANALVVQFEARLEELDLDESNLKTTLALEQRTLALLSRDYRRNLNLVRDGSISEQMLEQTEKDMLRQQLQIESVSHQLATLPSQRAQLKAQHDEATASLADARRRLGLTEIRTPFDCRIGEKHVALGQAVLPGNKLAEGHGVDVAEVEAGFTLEAFHLLRGRRGLADLSSGLDAQVRLESGDRTYTWSAEFLRFDASIDPQTRTVGVIVAVNSPYDTESGAPPLVKDLYCEVIIHAPERKGMLLPRSALHGEELYLLDAENRLRRQSVVIRSRQGDLVEVEGLKAGVVVILSDLTPAVTGMLIQPMDEQWVDIGGRP